MGIGYPAVLAQNLAAIFPHPTPWSIKSHMTDGRVIGTDRELEAAKRSDQHKPMDFYLLSIYRVFKLWSQNMITITKMSTMAAIVHVLSYVILCND